MEQREDNKNDIASRRLKNLFGEALGDLSSVEETETAWQAFASRRRQERVRTLVFGFAAVASVALLLSEEKKNLNQKVTLAAQLDATNIWIEPRNKRGKKAKKVKDIVKLAIGFTIVKNITAETGERTLYIRITKPDNDALTKSPSNTFPYENRTLTYSIKKYIEYNGEEQTINVFWDVEEFLYAGAYRVDIFADGTMIGSQKFTLD
jgi:hypothetical protein